MKTIRIIIVDDVLRVRQDLGTALTLASQTNQDLQRNERKKSAYIPNGNSHNSLENMPIEIIGEAENGQEAVRQVRDLNPDVVVLDLEMPVLDGYQAARQIKRYCPSCRIISLSVHDTEAVRQKAFQSGVDIFMVKGVPVKSLMQAIIERKE
jgi:CheY-like chemotaxis protein